jgi:glucuronate isomerase
MGFIADNFLLHNETARRLHGNYAAEQPILDYHCHLSPKDIAEDRCFKNLFEIWLEGDHYKWRAMRANGVHERYCTGDASPYEKFQAWASTVPKTLRNPLYHWTHLELKRYFGIDELLDEKTAAGIWKRANALLSTREFSARGILKRFCVKAVCTTDDPADDLEWHRKIAASNLPVRVYPTFRPDNALDVNLPQDFNSWLDRLAAVANCQITRLSDFLDALAARHADFHRHGGRLSDHGLDRCYADSCSDREAGAIFDKARSGQAASPEEYSRFASYMMLYFGGLDAEKGWTKQLHLGACRNVNTRMRAQLGADCGFDSIGDCPQTNACALYLDRLDQENALPKTIIYNANPSDNYVFATMIGGFQDSSVAGKIQLGSAWWFLDQKEGIEWQLNALSNTGLLSRFVGMVTDSRSFMSYPRHEYFRRVLCNLLGHEMQTGQLPAEEDLIGRMIEDICFKNAASYLALELAAPGQMLETSAARR